jgi:nucleoside-diphosphate-sugar epimerase
MAKGNSDARSVNVGGTRHILEAALRMGVCRVVHVSSSIVYSPWPDGVVDETFPRVPDGTGTSYHDTKLESEELALGYHRQYGLSVVVVQPVAVYGPWAQAWTLDVLGQLVQNTVLLVGGATAYHNFVYVDDVASGLVLAAEADSVSGESYLIGGSEKILIRDFYARYEQMLGVQSAVIVSRRELEGRVDLGSLYRERGLSMEKAPLIAGTFTTSTYFSIEKARRSLGYEPRFSFDRGMELTRQWAWEQGLCGDRSRAT